MRSRQHLIRHALGVFVLAILLVLSPAGTSSRAYAGVDFAVAALCLGSESPSISAPSPSTIEQAQPRVIASRTDVLRASVKRSECDALVAPRGVPSANGRAQLYLQYCSWLC